MSEIVLTGIKADIPIGAMAAFGLFRIMNCIRAPGETRLYWARQGSSWRPVLSTDRDASEEELIQDLLAYLQSDSERREFTWRREIKSATPKQFTEAATPAIVEAQSTDHGLADWFSAFTNELITTDEETLEPTPFDMTVAQQRFLTDSNSLAVELAGDEKASASMREALFGPWKYGDEQHSLGWDPSTILLGAFTVKKPETMKKWGVRAAVWLATESLPLFPCFCAGSKLATRAVRSVGRGEFCWPVWSSPISLAVLKSLLASADLIDGDMLNTLRARGVDGVFRSRKFKPNKYMVSFQPAVFTSSDQA
jgi:hypothetical protein